MKTITKYMWHNMGIFALGLGAGRLYSPSNSAETTVGIIIMIIGAILVFSLGHGLVKKLK